MLLSERLARLFQVFKVHLFPSIRCTYVHWVPISGRSSLVGYWLHPELAVQVLHQLDQGHDETLYAVFQNASLVQITSVYLELTNH